MKPHPQLTRQILTILQSSHNWNQLTPTQQEAATKLARKLGRLLNRTHQDFNPPSQPPSEHGWYLTQLQGKTQYLAYGNGAWWLPTQHSWVLSPHQYHWKGPVAPIGGPAPDGTNPQDGFLAWNGA